MYSGHGPTLEGLSWEVSTSFCQHDAQNTYPGIPGGLHPLGCGKATTGLSRTWWFVRTTHRYLEPLLRAVDKKELGTCEVAVIAYRTRDPWGWDPPAESSGWLSSIADVSAQGEDK